MTLHAPRPAVLFLAVLALLTSGVLTASPAQASVAVGQYAAEWGASRNRVPEMVSTSGPLAGKSVVRAASGRSHSCVVTADGGVFCWGSGALGNDSTETSALPVAVDMSGALAGKRVIDVAAGDNHTCVVTSDGAAFCWGVNGFGQLGNNSRSNSRVPVAVAPSGVLSGQKLVRVKAGWLHTCVLSSVGRMFCWGWNATGQLGNNSTADGLVPVAVSTSGVLANKVVIDIAAATWSSCAVTSDGKVACWGRNTQGQLGNNTTTDSLVPVAVSTAGVLANKVIVQVSSGPYHSCGVSSDGAVFCWGSNGFGALGNGTETWSGVPVAVVMSGVLNGKSVAQVSAGTNHACAVSSDGGAFCWGRNVEGALGNNSTENSPAPVAVDTSGVLAGRRVLQVAAGDTATAAVFDSPAQFVPLSPTRVFDSRAAGGPLQPGSAVVVDVAAAVPPGTAAVSYNVTVTGQTASGFAEVAPAGAPSGSSTINWGGPLQTIANGHIARVAGGKLQVTVGGAGTAHVILDITGAFVPPGTRPDGAAFAVSERRLYDSRANDGPLAAGASRTLNISNAMAASMAQEGPNGSAPLAAAVNVTVTGTTGSGVLSVAKTVTTATSTINWSGPRQTLANGVITDVAADGSFNVTNNGRTPTHVLVDLTGVFTSGVSGALFVPMDPARSYDSRLAGPPLASGSTRLTDQNIPREAVAVVLNTTITGTTGTGFISITHPGTTPLTTSTLNWYDSPTTRANATITPTGEGKARASLGGSNSTHYIHDVAGYFR